MRLIDADALRKCFEVPHELKCGIQAGMDEYALKCIDEQPTVASPPLHWVSVFDDLPRHNAVVVVSDGKRSWDVGQYHFLFKADDRTIWWWKKHTTRKVLWWMYKEDAIPEPPKEDA